MAVYAIYKDVLVEVLERHKGRVFIKQSNVLHQWVKESEIELWALGNSSDLVRNARGQRKASADAPAKK